MAFTGRIKFEAAGLGDHDPLPCNPIGHWWDPDRCSDIWMYTDKGGKREYNRVGRILTDTEFVTDNGW